MNIFVSHADADKELATKLVDLLQLGIGVPHADIFCSSSKGRIPNGDFFVQHILSRINEADFVIALLSRSYFESHFCQAEAGAALARQAAGLREFVSYAVPPVKFSELDGVLYGLQSGSILDVPSLGELRDRIRVAKPPATSVWDEKREDFLKTARRTVTWYEAKESLSHITVADYKWFPDDKQETKVHRKLLVTLNNGTGRPFTVESGQWISGSEGVPPFERSQRLKWRIGPKDPETLTTQVPPDVEFRTWIGPNESVEQAEVLRRSAARRTGTMRLTLQIEGHVLDHELLF